MGIARVYRVIEGSFVTLFFVQAARVVLAVLTSMTGTALATGEVDLLLVNAHLLLAAALIPVWFSPRVRTALPETLSVSAIVVTVARIALNVQTPLVKLYGGAIVIGVACIYMASLLRANWRSFISVLVAALMVDQLLRARATFDVSLGVWLEVAAAGSRYRLPWIVIQVLLAVVVIVISRLARRAARHEPYEPAFLTIWGALALGGFLALEIIVFSLPGVVARWTGLPYTGLVPWFVLATALPLLPGMRRFMAATMNLFDERIKGVIWVLLLLLLLVIGNRFDSLAAGAALIVAQFFAVMAIWWIPTPPDPAEVEQVGPSISLAVFVMFVSVYLYELTFSYAYGLGWLRDQGILVLILASVLLGVPFLSWREEDPWLIAPKVPQGVPMAFVAPAVLASLIISGSGIDVPPSPVNETIRVATYNINGGYDEQGVYQLPFITRTIEASYPDIVVLQEVDAGRPASFGVDQAIYISRRMNMHHLYLPLVEQTRGLTILSRWPLVAPESVMYPSEGAQHGALEGTLIDAATGRQVTIVGTQFSPGSDEQRIEQLAVLLSMIGEQAPLVLAGDMGASPGDAVYDQLVGASGFQDADASLGIERGYTYPAQDPVARLDMVLLRGMQAIDSRQVNSSASDHRLVVVEMGWSSP